MFTSWNHFQFNIAVPQTVNTLLGHKSKKISLLSSHLCFGNIPCRKVAAAQVSNFSFTYQLLHRLKDFFPWSFAIYVMHLIQINMIGFHSLQAIFASLADMIRRKL